MCTLRCAVAVAVLLFAGCQRLFPLNNYGPPTRQMSLDGTSLAYVDEGAGVPVVFVHGGFSDHRVWEPQRRSIAPFYRFIALTQRYFGTHPWPDEGERFSLETHTNDLAAFVRQLNAGPVYLVGRSYGGTVAISFALQHPELVSGVFVQEPTLLSAVTNPTDLEVLSGERAEMAPVRSAIESGNLADATRLFADWTNGQPGGFDALPAENRAIHLANARTVPLNLAPPAASRITCAELATMQAPLVITVGELTRPYFRIAATATQRCVPGSRLIEIPGGRHAASDQNPAAFNEALLGFLAAGR